MIRQEELNVKRRETEKKLLEAQTRDNKGVPVIAVVIYIVVYIASVITFNNYFV